MRFKWVLLLGLILGSIHPAFSEQVERSNSPSTVLWINTLECGFDLRSREGLSNLVRMADLWTELSEAQEARLTIQRQQMVQALPLESMTVDQLQKYFSEPADYITPEERRGLKEIQRCAMTALEQPDKKSTEKRLAEILELGAAIDNKHRPVVPSKLSITQLPNLLRGALDSPVAEGTRPAANAGADRESDGSRVDPARSGFWDPMSAISSADLYAGYGRSALPDLTNRVWTYSGPKRGSGISPGFQAQGGKDKIKIKFHEITSEPFTARIFWALGYHVDPVDYVPFLKVRYSRRLFREMHLRHETPIPIKFFGITFHQFHYQPRFDPFEFITTAVLKDGSQISGQELKRRVFYNANLEHPEDDPNNFRPDMEERVDYVVTCAASVQIRDPDVKSVGPWDFSGLGHEDRRELRGAGLAAAWLNWCDSQFQNTRVRVVHEGKKPHCEYYFCDLGGGMGQGTGFFFRRYETPNDLDWTFTKPGKVETNGNPTGRFRIVGYKPVKETGAFREMTPDDARWMARKIGQLTETQLLEALIAAGFDSAQSKIYLEKLISRRDQMIIDLGLAGEMALLRPSGPAKHCSYDPQKDGELSVCTRSGQVAEAQKANWIVVDGRVVSNPSTQRGTEPKTPMHKPEILSMR